MKGLSMWTLSALAQLKNATEIHKFSVNKTLFRILETDDAVWVSVSYNDGLPIYFNTCSISTGGIKNITIVKENDGLHVEIDALIGNLELSISFGEGSFPFLTYKTEITPHTDLFIPFSPRDILTAHSPSESQKSWGELHLSQIGTRSGLAYFTKEKSRLRVMYMQNLTALSPYAQQTGTSLTGVVSGQLPQIGLSVPPAIENPLKKGQKITISDAYICFKPIETRNADLSLDYLDLTAAVYLLMPRPDTHYVAMPDILKKGLKDLIENPGCWSMVAGNSYLNAYVSDYETPPEIMVQLAVLLPLVDYKEWSGEEVGIISTIKRGLQAFYNEKLKTIVRWHPAAQDKLKGDEEQKMPMIMDSWYLHHPLLNLSRLALKGDHDAEKLFLDSINFAIKVAHQFKYNWPVFYKMDTLEIIKAETADGEGGEQDVPGLYAHIMLQAFELTGDKKYLMEAERSAKKMKSLGMKIMYQANNTAFGAGALLRLYKITGKEIYLTLSYRCLASVFQNVQLWDCNYGYGKNIPTFFALFPLADAPYTAAYEEQEVFCALHDYLKHADEIEIMPSLRLLCCEYIRYLVERAPYYYPPMLPKEMISDDVKTGEVDPALWIALEDIQDGNIQSGSVGQEVYGAGNAFGIMPRHYIRSSNDDFLIYTDYPFSGLRHGKQSVSFHLQGDARISCRLRIIATDGHKNLSKIIFTLKGKDVGLTSVKGKDYLEAVIPGNFKVAINWKYS